MKRKKKRWKKPQIEVIKSASERIFLDCAKADYANATSGNPLCTEPTMCVSNHFS